MVADSSGVNAPLVDQAGNQLVNIPAWQPNTLYPQGYVVQNGGVAYMASATFTSGASFGADGSNWAPLSSAELAYAQITSSFRTTSSTGYVNVTGLSITVVTNGRPFLVRFGGAIQNSASGGYAYVQIFRTTDSTVAWGRAEGVGAAYETWSGTIEVRQALAAGTYSYQLQLASNSSGNTASVPASAGGPSFLQALQI